MGVILQERGEDLNGKVRRLPQRYRRLVGGVLHRLPHDWLGERSIGRREIEWAVVVSDDIHITHRGCVVLASAARERFETLQYWTITLFPHVLDELSDRAVLWVIAHEFGHIVARVSPEIARPQGIFVPLFDMDCDEFDDVAVSQLGERCADAYALGWGFLEEKAAYDRELPTL